MTDPAWLTDDVKLVWVNAVIEYVHGGGGTIGPGVYLAGPPRERPPDWEERWPLLVERLTTPDGEHNILVWLAGVDQC